VTDNTRIIKHEAALRRQSQLEVKMKQNQVKSLSRDLARIQAQSK